MGEGEPEGGCGAADGASAGAAAGFGRGLRIIANDSRGANLEHGPQGARAGPSRRIRRGAIKVIGIRAGSILSHQFPVFSAGAPHEAPERVVAKFLLRPRELILPITIAPKSTRNTTTECVKTARRCSRVLIARPSQGRAFHRQRRGYIRQRAPRPAREGISASGPDTNFEASRPNTGPRKLRDARPGVVTSQP